MNTAYKKLLVLSRALGAPEPDEIFERAGVDVSKSQLHAWRLGDGHRHFRPIPADMVASYLDGLIHWVDSENAGNE